MIKVVLVGRMEKSKLIDVALTARAFGASELIATQKEQKDKLYITKYFKEINDDWGSSFKVSFDSNWKKLILERNNNYKTIYLTKYGSSIKKSEYAISTYKNIMLIVSTTDNIKELYDMADFNISLTTQPHTIISSIAVFLNMYYKGRELAMHFENAKYKIIPENHGIHITKSH